MGEGGNLVDLMEKALVISFVMHQQKLLGCDFDFSSCDN